MPVLGSVSPKFSFPALRLMFSSCPVSSLAWYTIDGETATHAAVLSLPKVGFSQLKILHYVHDCMLLCLY
jgi:hypothetical protein